MATTVQGKFEGPVRGPFGIAWEPDLPGLGKGETNVAWHGTGNAPKEGTICRDTHGSGLL
jgi:hypothetical protein